MTERNYRDPLHNIIRVELTSGEGRLLTRLIDAREFQRLRRIRQLGLGNFAYQGAEHSRFTHSLGAFHLATRILDKLSVRYPIEEMDRVAVRAAALLHDIGHGPFSHVVEGILGFHHEEFTAEAVESDVTEIGRLLREHSSELPEKVASIIRGNFRPRALAQLVSSQLDVDRMDYLLRDSLMTGVKYGIFDLEWVIKSLEIDVENDRVYVATPGIYAVESYLQARHYMFRQVYFHRTLRAAEAILHAILKRALYLVSAGHDLWFPKDTAIERILSGSRLSLVEHLSIDDADITFCIKQWQRASDPVISDLASRFLDRRLFRAFDLDMSETDRERFVNAARSVVADAGFDPEYYLVEDRAGNIEHHFYSREGEDEKNLIYVQEGYAAPRMREISEVSAAVRGLQRGYRIQRIAFPDQVKERITELYHPTVKSLPGVTSVG